MLVSGCSSNLVKNEKVVTDSPSLQASKQQQFEEQRQTMGIKPREPISPSITTATSPELPVEQPFQKIQAIELHEVGKPLDQHAVSEKLNDIVLIEQKGTPASQTNSDPELPFAKRDSKKLPQTEARSVTSKQSMEAQTVQRPTIVSGDLRSNVIFKWTAEESSVIAAASAKRRQRMAQGESFFIQRNDKASSPLDNVRKAMGEQR